MKLLTSKGTSEMFNRETMNRKLYEWIRQVFDQFLESISNLAIQ